MDEPGTEAAAATAVIIGLTALPGLEVTVKRPFIFLIYIYDRQTGALLFVGRVVNPAQ